MTSCIQGQNLTNAESVKKTSDISAFCMFIEDNIKKRQKVRKLLQGLEIRVIN
jgi:hypothetical protein